MPCTCLVCAFMTGFSICVMHLWTGSMIVVISAGGLMWIDSASATSWLSSVVSPGSPVVADPCSKVSLSLPSVVDGAGVLGL